MCLTEREPGLTQQRLDRSVDTARPTRNGKSGPLEESSGVADAVSPQRLSCPAHLSLDTTKATLSERCFQLTLSRTVQSRRNGSDRAALLRGDEMTTITNQLIVATLAAALSVTALEDAQAAKNDGRFQTSAEAQHAKICTELQSSYNTNMNYYNEKPAKRGRWKTTAENLKTLAQGNDCSWAA